MADDNLSYNHFMAVLSEINGRFFTQKEADQLKESIDRRIVTNPEIRAAAAATWEVEIEEKADS